MGLAVFCGTDSTCWGWGNSCCQLPHLVHVFFDIVCKAFVTMIFFPLLSLFAHLLSLVVELLPTNVGQNTRRDQPLNGLEIASPTRAHSNGTVWLNFRPCECGEANDNKFINQYKPNLIDVLYSTRNRN